MVMIPPGWSDLGNGQYADENGNLVQEKDLFIQLNSLLINNLFTIRLVAIKRFSISVREYESRW